MTERTIFFGALEREDPAERAAYLDAVCAGKPALQLALQRARAFWGLKRDPAMDSELRILSWDIWDLSKAPAAQTVVNKLVDCWASEDPTVAPATRSFPRRRAPTTTATARAKPIAPTGNGP